MIVSRLIPKLSISPQRLRWALRAVGLGVVAQGVITGAPHVSRNHLPVLWLAAALFLITFALVRTIEHPLMIVLNGTGSVGLALVLTSITPFIAAIVTVALAGTLLSERRASIVSAGVIAGYLAAQIAQTGFSTNLVQPLSGLLFTFLASLSLRRLREEQDRTRHLLQEVVAGRDDRIRAAALDERARLAREMHDILAHSLSALAIQLEGARLLAERRPGDPAVLSTIERAGRLAREGLLEARRAVGSLREEALPGPDSVPELAAAFELDTGIPVQFSIDGQPLALPPDARLAIYRIAQEALTNVRKHAAARKVALALRYDDDGADLTVTDEGDPYHEQQAIQNSEDDQRSPPGGGFGITGMRERAELLGGHLEAGPVPGGWRVHLWVPV